MSVHRKLTPLLLTAGALATAVAVAAPASAIGKVTCPARPTWSHGVEIWTDYGFDVCYAGTVGTATLNTSRVDLATSGWNYATVYDTGGGYAYLVPGSAWDYINDYPYHEVTVDEVNIING